MISVFEMDTDRDGFRDTVTNFPDDEQAMTYVWQRIRARVDEYAYNCLSGEMKLEYDIGILDDCTSFRIEMDEDTNIVFKIADMTCLKEPDLEGKKVAVMRQVDNEMPSFHGVYGSLINAFTTTSDLMSRYGVMPVYRDLLLSLVDGFYRPSMRGKYEVEYSSSVKDGEWRFTTITIIFGAMRQRHKFILQTVDADRIE